VPETSFAALERALEEKRLRVEAALARLAPREGSPDVEAAIAHSLFAPAKRLRPVLALLVAEVLRAESAPVLPAACAVEMVHTASLILDDLPSMDDASRRRGRPACHVAHGEANAILAAFALINRAFEVLAEDDGALATGTRLNLARELAAAVGLQGMIAGQAADLAFTDRAVDFATLEYIHSRKTGALFTCCAALGAAAGGAHDDERRALVAYAKNLGLAFQIVDDLLDAVGGTEAGKDLRQDLRKTTFVSFAGVEGARQIARELIETSIAALAGFSDRAEPLRELARYVVARPR
jgi:geranylgeranyl diphosphate synthase type II